MFNNSDIDDCVNIFYKCINKEIAENVPTRTVKQNTSSYPDWYSSDLIKNIILKKKLHKISIQSGLQDDEIYLKRQRALCIRLSRIDYKKYIDYVENSSRLNIKNFWKFLNSFRKSNSIPESVFLGNSSSDDLQGTCNLFATYFSSQYTCHPPFFHDCLYSDIPIDFDINITEDEVLSALIKVKESSALGSDGLPSIFIKRLAVCMLRPICMLFNLSVNSGVMPIIWKKSFITPIFKSGNRSNVESYRPITILSTIS